VRETLAEDKTYGAANITTNKRLEFQNHLSYVQPESMTWSLPDMERITIQLKREIYSITSNE
jgi:hypothetical protein